MYVQWMFFVNGHRQLVLAKEVRIPFLLAAAVRDADELPLPREQDEDVRVLCTSSCLESRARAQRPPTPVVSRRARRMVWRRRAEPTSAEHALACQERWLVDDDWLLVPRLLAAANASWLMNRRQKRREAACRGACRGVPTQDSHRCRSRRAVVDCCLVRLVGKSGKEEESKKWHSFTDSHTRRREKVRRSCAARRAGALERGALRMAGSLSRSTPYRTKSFTWGASLLAGNGDHVDLPRRSRHP